MGSKHCFLSIVVSFLTWLQHVKESLVEAYVCDSEYSYNGRPVNVPEGKFRDLSLVPESPRVKIGSETCRSLKYDIDVYRTYCCEATSLDSRTTAYSRFSCAEKGGCCGQTDSQYCCDRGNLGLTLSLGIGGGFFVLIVIIIIWICWCVKKKRACFEPLDYDRPLGADSVWRLQSRDTLDVIRSRENTAATSSYYHAQNTERDSDSALSAFTMTSREHHVPTAPPISNSDLELDNLPPSYEEVVKNPDVYPGTNTPTAKE